MKRGESGCVEDWLCVWWCGVCGPSQSTDNGVVRVDDPAAAVVVKNGAVILL